MVSLGTFILLVKLSDHYFFFPTFEGFFLVFLLLSVTNLCVNLVSMI